MKDSFEILAIITKDYPEFEGKKDKFRSLTKGFNSDKYFDFLKVLNDNTIYSLNSNYEIKYEKEKLITVTKTKASFNVYSYEKKPNIQVNSIVGKNGSGKSTLSEILYLMLYNLSIDKKLLYDENDKQIKSYKGFLNAYLIIKKGEEIVCVDFEILDFFEHEYSQKNNSKNINFFKKELNNYEACEFDFSVVKSVDFNIKELFYMISLNYSMYGLNELKMGKWIKHIFHKNDMYDTPIVITPYREFGRIDVNTEDTQSNARVISNLSKRLFNSENATLSKDYKFNQLNVFYYTKKRKTAFITTQLKNYIEGNLLIKSETLEIESHLSIRAHYSPYSFFETEENDTLSSSKLQPLISFTDVNYMTVKDYATVLLQNSQEAFDVIHQYFYNIKNITDLNEIISNIQVLENKFIIEDLFSYFICKLYRIGINYNKEFGELLNKEQNGFNKGEEFERTIVKVLTSDSHACFKLKRVYYFLNFSKGKGTLKFVAETKDRELISWTLKELNSKIPESLNYLKSIKTDREERTYSNGFYHLLDKHFFEENDLAWKIPPPVFQTNCLVENIRHSKKRVNLNELSSGETQFIYALQTVLYHIINIDSNKEYKNIVLLLDEIELYYHPEYQRVFLNTLLTQINELKLNHIENIQIIFLTHSPFILSDIPSSNILRLIEGKSEPEDTQTFGANIHDLLENDFFLKKGSMGEFAKIKIDEVIGWLNIQRIQNELEEMEIEVNFSKKESLKKEIIKTKTKELEELKNRIPKLSKEYCSSIIEIIDEPLLKYTLDEMYNVIYPQTKDKKLEEIRNFAKKIGRNDIANKLDDML